MITNLTMGISIVKACVKYVEKSSIVKKNVIKSIIISNGIKSNMNINFWKIK